MSDLGWITPNPLTVIIIELAVIIFLLLVLIGVTLCTL